MVISLFLIHLFCIFFISFPFNLIFLKLNFFQTIYWNFFKLFLSGIVFKRQFLCFCFWFLQQLQCDIQKNSLVIEETCTIIFMKIEITSFLSDIWKITKGSLVYVWQVFFNMWQISWGRGYYSISQVLENTFWDMNIF